MDNTNKNDDIIDLDDPHLFDDLEEPQLDDTSPQSEIKEPIKSKKKEKDIDEDIQELEKEIERLEKNDDEKAPDEDIMIKDTPVLKTVTLSFLRFLEILRMNRYVIMHLYCINGNCKFAELKSPKFHKIFIIRVPDKYIIPVKNIQEKDKVSNIYKHTLIKEADIRQIEFLNLIKGPLVDVNLISISGKKIYNLIGDKGEIFKFKSKKEKENKNKKEKDTIKKLEKKIDKISKKIDKQPPIKLVDPPPQKDENKDDQPIDDTDFVFEEQDGTVIEHGGPLYQMLVNEPTQPKGMTISLDEGIIDEDEKEEDEKEEVEEEKKEKKTRLNEKPRNMSSLNVKLGMIYVCIDVNEFFEKIETYENDLYEIYSNIDETELQARNRRIEKIEDKLTTIGLLLNQKLEYIHLEETKIKQQLTELTSVIIKCDSLQKKLTLNSKDETKEKPNPLGGFIKLQSYKKRSNIEDLNDIYKIQNATHLKMDELNTKLLELRDTVDKILYKNLKILDKYSYKLNKINY
jgi:hypothetical protein